MITNKRTCKNAIKKFANEIGRCQQQIIEFKKKTGNHSVEIEQLKKTISFCEDKKQEWQHKLSTCTS